MEADFSQEDMESIQGGLDPSGATGGDVPSGFSSDLGSGDSAEDFNSFISSFGLNPQQTYTVARGAKSKALGDNVNNPYPESFFSKLFGAENVDYTNILGSSGTDRINDLRFRQATGESSLITGQPYQAGDFYIGQPTEMGVVKPIPNTMSNILNILPAGGILNAFIPQKGLPEFDPRYQEMIKEREKSANDPTIFDSVLDFVREKTGFGPKDSGASLAASPTGDGQMRVPDTRTFDAFGNVLKGGQQDFPFSLTPLQEENYMKAIQRDADRKLLSDTDMFQAKPKVQKVADVGQTFRNIRDTTRDVVGPDGVPVFGNENLRFRITVDPEKQEPKANFIYKFDTV